MYIYMKRRYLLILICIIQVFLVCAKSSGMTLATRQRAVNRMHWPMRHTNAEQHVYICYSYAACVRFSWRWGDAAKFECSCSSLQFCVHY